MMKNQIVIGTDHDGRRATIDVRRLIETRLLIQSNSGGGKSMTARKLMEELSGVVQVIALDTEGELSTIRTDYPFILAAVKNGDIGADPRTAKVLADKLLETRGSAICDLSELKPHERTRFVRLFAEALVDAPRKLWHPVLVILDEAQIYAPEKGHGESESCAAVIDLATRGRKRGICLVLATQRLSKLHKDAAAEMRNVMIGSTGLDLDVRRAADILGLPFKSAMPQLRDLEPGQFFAFGPAISKGVIKIQVEKARTKHPKLGERFLTPPKPSAEVLRILKKLDDLPAEAEYEARSIEELKSLNAKLRRELNVALQGVKQSGVPVDEITRRVKAAVAENSESFKKRLGEGEIVARNLRDALEECRRSLGTIHATSEKALKKPIRELTLPKPTVPATFTPPTVSPPLSRARQVEATTQPDGGAHIRAGARRILQELASRRPAGYTKSQVATLTGFTASGGTFNQYLSDLRKNGFIAEEKGLLYASDQGFDFLGADIPPTPKTREEVLVMWRKALRAGAFKMLTEVIRSGEQGLTRHSLAEIVGMEVRGGTFNQYLSDLRKNHLIHDHKGHLTPNTLLLGEV